MAAVRTRNLITFTNQFTFFGFFFQGQGQGTTVVPPSSAVEQFLIGGPDLTEHFITNGTISAMNVSYTINPLSRRTV